MRKSKERNLIGLAYLSFGIWVDIISETEKSFLLSLDTPVLGALNKYSTQTRWVRKSHPSIKEIRDKSEFSSLVRELYVEAKNWR